MHILLLIIVCISVWPTMAMPRPVAARIPRNNYKACNARSRHCESGYVFEKDVATEQAAAKTLIGGYIQTTYTDFEKQNSNLISVASFSSLGRKFPKLSVYQ